MAYAGAADLRGVLTQVPAGNAYDLLLQDALDRATEIIDGILGFTFAPWALAATDRDVRARATWEYLELPAYKAGSITGVTEISARGLASESEAAITEYLAEEEVRPYRLYYGYGWTNGTFYRVTAIWGYGPPPAVVTGICLDLAKDIYAARNARITLGTAVLGIDNTQDVSRVLTNEQHLRLMNVRKLYLGVVHA